MANKPAAKTTEPEPTYSRRRLAPLFGYSHKTIGAALKGVEPAALDGRTPLYTIEQTHRALVARLQIDKVAQQLGGVPRSDERERLETLSFRVKTERDLLRLGKEKEITTLRADLVKTAAEHGQAVSTHLLQLPNRLAPTLALQSDAHAIKIELERALRKALDTLPDG